MAKELTEKQQLFLDALFGEAEGDPVVAKKIAGYAKTMPSTAITKSLQNEIAERTREMIAVSGPRAAFAMMNILSDPTALGNKDKLAAAKDLLDRAGFKPSDKVEVSSANPLFILPEKNDEE